MKSQNDPKVDELLAQAITETVCAKFQDWSGSNCPASSGLKADVYLLVLKILQEGVET